MLQCIDLHCCFQIPLDDLHVAKGHGMFWTYAHLWHQNLKKNRGSNLHTFWVCWSTVEPCCAVCVVAGKGALCPLVCLHRLWGAGPLVCCIRQSLQTGCVCCGHRCAQNLHVHHIRFHHVYRLRDPRLGSLQSWGLRTGSSVAVPLVPAGRLCCIAWWMWGTFAALSAGWMQAVWFPPPLTLRFWPPYMPLFDFG